MIKSVYKNSIAEEMGIEAGDALLSINGQEITDIFDYQYLIQDEYVEILVRKEAAKSGLWKSTRDMMKIWAWNLRTD